MELAPMFSTTLQTVASVIKCVLRGSSVSMDIVGMLKRKLSKKYFFFLKLKMVNKDFTKCFWLREVRYILHTI